MDNKYNIVFVLGPPGAGKGTQGELISKKFDYFHLSPGDLLRNEMYKESEIGKRIKELMQSNTIVSSDETCPLLESAMKDSGKKNFLIDGFPRTKENFDGWNTKMSGKVNLKFVLYISCPFEVFTQRCLARGRQDDNEASLRKRFDTFEHQTKPILEAYKELGLLRQVDGSKSVDEVFEEVKQYFLENL